MDFTAIIYAAIGGGAGAGLGHALAGMFSKSKSKTETDEIKAGEANFSEVKKSRSGIGSGLAGGLAVAGMLGLPALYKNMTLPRIVPLDETEFLESEPIYKLIKEQSPEDYKRFLGPLDRATRNGNVTQKDLDEIRVVLFEQIKEKTALANAEVLRDLNNVSVLQSEIYNEKEPSICTLIFNGEPYPDVSDILTEDVAEKERVAMVSLFTEAPRDSTIVVDLERGEQLLTEIAANIITELGISNVRPEITNTAENRVEHQKICEFNALFIQKQHALLDQDLYNVQAYLNSL